MADKISLKRKRPSDTDSVDLEKCIICQKVDKKCKVSSTDNGRQNIIDAASVKQDVVHDRIQKVDQTRIVYHVNNSCYKSYSMKKSIDYIKSKKIEEKEESTDTGIPSGQPTRPVSRSSVPQRAPVDKPDVDPVHRKTCVICNHINHKGVFEKYRICEGGSATKFLDAVKYFMDEVYIRTCDLHDIESIFGADLYCHTQCKRAYLQKYDRAVQQSSRGSNPVSRKTEIFNQLVSDIDNPLKSGCGFSLSFLRDKANQILHSQPHEHESDFTNRDVQVMMYDQYPDIQMSLPLEANKSAMVFLNVTPDEMVDRIRASNPIKETAGRIRNDMKKVDMHLSDRFCDANDLEESWKDIQIPHDTMKFLSTLLNCDCMEEDLEYDSDDTEDTSKDSIKPKERKLRALFQIMYFIIHNGRQKTPLHILVAEAIHSTCKSSTLITSFNHLGICISYDELRRYHSDLAHLIVESSEGNVPLPSQFDPNEDTLAAFDNFDHSEATLSGIGDSHDSVAVLFQDKPRVMKRKPAISETNVPHGVKVFKEELSCQKLQEFPGKTKKSNLPESYTVEEALYEGNKETMKTVQVKDYAWILAKLHQQQAEGEFLQTTPSWSSFNSIVTEENLQEKIIGFLPILPYPITEYETVFTMLRNFQNLRRQLAQSSLPVACDEGVYRIGRDIILANPEEFKDLVLILGNFHMIKTVLRCVGKYLKGSGAETIFTENSVFGPNVAQQVIAGSHYERSLTGFTMLAEVMLRLQWKVFFESEGAEKYSKPLESIKELKQSVDEKDRSKSQAKLHAFSESSEQLLQDFEQFKAEQKSKSETFVYWDTFIELMYLVWQLVRADREGLWELHLECVQRALPLFIEFDATNYIRWASLYLEDMRRLPETHPGVHTMFMEGKFVVKRKGGPFTAVPLDMALEQTINKSSKSAGGIIGSTKKKEFVGQWNLTYHELLAVSNLFRELCAVKTTNNELNITTSASTSDTARNESSVVAMMTYVQSYENPFLVAVETEQKLHNILTQAIMPDQVRDDLLNVFEKGQERYKIFREERFQKKSAQLFSPIHRVNLKTFSSSQDKKISDATRKRREKKSLCQGQKLIDLARVRGYDVRELFKYDLVDSNYLFDEEQLMTPNHDKYLLGKELESHLPESELKKPYEWEKKKTAYMVDVMIVFRKVKTKGLETFGDFCQKAMEIISKICPDPSRIDFVLDTYLEKSVKEGERSRRAKTLPIEQRNIRFDTRLEKDMSYFWPSIKNKEQLEILFSEWVTEKAESEWPDVEIVISGMSNGSLTCSSLNGDIPQLDGNWEEADVRLVPHAQHAAQAGYERLVIQSPDNDVLVLFLHFSDQIMANGAHEIWMRAGVGETTRYLPLHIMSERLGNDLCQVLPALHNLTGADCTSKFGTKKAALKANPEFYLQSFGHNEEDICLEQAEEYLVKVWKANTQCTTMDELRYNLYHHSKLSIVDLPPTSYSLEAHIQRAFYHTFIQTHCLENKTLDARNYGYEEVQNDTSTVVFAKINGRNLPDELTLSCTCVKCATNKYCKCRQEKLPCCVFCRCRRDENNNTACRNPYIVLNVPLNLETA